MKLYVVRHGQTDYNRERRFQGQSEISLNAEGKIQARRAGLVVAQLIAAPLSQNHKVSCAIISSDLVRTRETTQIISSEIMNISEKASPKITFDARLREFHCGAFEHSTYEEFVKRSPEIAGAYMTQFDLDNYGTRYPGEGGESRLDVMQRVGNVLQESCQLEEIENLIWVVHGGVIDVLLELLHIQKHGASAQRIAAGNGDVFVLKKSNSGQRISEHSLRFGHTDVWEIERHYRIGDTIAARVVK